MGSSAHGTDSALSERCRKLQSWDDNLLPADHTAPSRLLLFPQKKRFPGGAVCHGCFMMSLLLQVRRSQAGLVSNPWKGVGFTEIHKEENLDRNSGILKYILMVSLFPDSSFTFISCCLSFLAVPWETK